MNVLPTAIEYLADRTVAARAGSAAPQLRARQGSIARRSRSPQLPLALPLGQRTDNRQPSPSAASAGPPAAPPAASPATARAWTPAPAPAFDALAAAGALWSGLGSAGVITRIDAPACGWPDALVQPGDAVLVAAGAPVAEGALAAVRLMAVDAIALRRVHRSGERHVRLQPEDRSVPPLIVPVGDVELIGPVVTIVRRSGGEAAARRRTA